MNIPVTLVAVLLGSLLLISIPMGAQDGVYDDTEFSRQLRAESPFLLHGDMSGLSPDDALLIFAPDKAYTNDDVFQIRTYLENGGRVLVAAERAAGRALVAALDVGIQISGDGVFSPAHGDEPNQPYVLTTDRIPGLPDALPIKSPRIVTGDGPAVLTSTALSWRDVNDDGKPGLLEPQGTWAFARTTNVGSGELLAIGSPELLANQNYSVHFIDWLTQGERRLVVDEAHRAPADPVGLSPILSGAVTWPALVAIPVIIVATVIWATRLRLVRLRRGRRPTDASKWHLIAWKELP